MAIEEEIVNQQPTPAPTEEAPQEDGRLTKDEEDDLAIAVLLAENIIDDGGIDVIDTAVKESSNPGEVIGQFLMQLVMQLSEEMPREMSFSPRIFFAEGGWVEEISDYLQEEYGIPQEAMDKAEIFIAAQASSMSKGAEQQGSEQIAQNMVGQQQPAMPQQGGMA